MTVKQVEKAIENKTTLYFESTCGGIFSGTPTEIITREPKTYVKMKNCKDLNHFNMYDNAAKLDDLGKSISEIVNKIHEKTESVYRKLNEKIQTKDDLIQCMFDSNISGCDECRDYDARTAVIRIAKEKFNIKLGDE